MNSNPTCPTPPSNLASPTQLPSLETPLEPENLPNNEPCSNSPESPCPILEQPPQVSS